MLRSEGSKIRSQKSEFKRRKSPIGNAHGRQTLRLYEREGILLPSRSNGNTRLYTQSDLERLEFILKLARDLGVNIAGIHIILNMRERMSEMEKEMQAFVEFVQKEIFERPPVDAERMRTALMRVGQPPIVRSRPGK